MSVNWEFLAGDTDRFALKLSLASDPYEGRGVSEEMSASWGHFELWVAGRNLCAQSDSGETLDAVHWYLLPLLEWLVENWDPLLHEERLPIEVAGATAIRSLHQTAYAATDEPRDGAAGWQPWWSRHSLSAARAGGLFPEVIFRRYRDQVEISWDSLIIPGAPQTLAFTAPLGTTRLPTVEVALPLATVLRATSAELERRCPDSERIAQLVGDLERLEDRDRTEQRTAWLAGLGSGLDDMLERWRSVAAHLADGGERLTAGLAERLFVKGTPKAVLMFGAVAPNVTAHDVDALTGFLLSLYTGAWASSRVDDTEWAELAGTIDQRSAPWRQGYDLALGFLDQIGADQSVATDIDALLQDLDVDVAEVPLEDPEIRGLAAAGPEHRPCIGLNPNYPFHERVEVQRFTKGHELCHLLFDRTDAREVAEASGPWAPIELEQRANAFSAMVLMPEPLLRAELGRLPDLVTDVAQLVAIGDRLRVSVRALAWHATNLGLVSRVVAQQAQMSIRPGPDSAFSPAS